VVLAFPQLGRHRYSATIYATHALSLCWVGLAQMDVEDFGLSVGLGLCFSHFCEVEVVMQVRKQVGTYLNAR